MTEPWEDLAKMKADAAREIYERAEAALEDRIVSIINRSTFRLAEDQMQRLMRCICAVGALILDDKREDATYSDAWESAIIMLEYEPKPEPAPCAIPDNSATFENFKRLLKENEQLKTCLSKMEELCRDAASKLAIAVSKIPKERLRAHIEYDPSIGMDVLFLKGDHGRSPYVLYQHESKSVLLQYAEDHGFEVVR